MSRMSSHMAIDTSNSSALTLFVQNDFEQIVLLIIDKLSGAEWIRTNFLDLEIKSKLRQFAKPERILLRFKADR